MRERRRLIAIGFYLVSSILCVLLIAGHGPWAGQTLWEISLSHGLNTGDLPDGVPEADMQEPEHHVLGHLGSNKNMSS